MASESGTTGGRIKIPSTADIIRGYGFDPNIVATLNGELINTFDEHQDDQSSVSQTTVHFILRNAAMTAEKSNFLVYQDKERTSSALTRRGWTSRSRVQQTCQERLMKEGLDCAKLSSSVLRLAVEEQFRRPRSGTLITLSARKGTCG